MKRIANMILTVILVCLMTISSFAADMYVYDQAGLLSESERIELENMAAVVADRYNCGVYVLTMDDYKKYSTGDVFETAVEIYHGMGFGCGEEGEGILLMLSMYERDYATYFYGENVEYAFDEFGQIELEEEFLDDFGENEWFDGFEDYIVTCEKFLGRAAAGDPVRESPWPGIAMVVVISVALAFLVTLGMRMSMKSVRRGATANAYVTDQGLNLTRRSDIFLYKNRTRAPIQRSSGSKVGGGSRSGGSRGGSGRSGKF